MTLSEKSTLTTPYYLFQFTSDLSGEIVVFLASDLSSATGRYNEFLITETSGTVNYSSGTIELNPTGQWTYKVYEQTSSSNLIVQNSDNYPSYVEMGIVRVKGNSESTYTDTTDNNIIIVDE